MHDAALQWLSRFATDESISVLDIGGRNINGSPRGLFPTADYTAIDLYPGLGVDVVADCRTWDGGGRQWDCVICAEVLEHTPDPRGVTRACVDYLTSGGRLLVTCAGPGRLPHSGHDGMPHLRDGEHYANIDPLELRLWLYANGLADVEVVDNAQVADVYATGVRP